jgi:hypothetical protein
MISSFLFVAVAVAICLFPSDAFICNYKVCHQNCVSSPRCIPDKAGCIKCHHFCDRCSGKSGILGIPDIVDAEFAEDREASRVFEEIDTRHDGLIDFYEAKEYAKLFDQSQEFTMSDFMKLDLDENGYLRPSKFDNSLNDEDFLGSTTSQDGYRDTEDTDGVTLRLSESSILAASYGVYCLIIFIIVCVILICRSRRDDKSGNKFYYQHPSADFSSESKNENENETKV